MSDTYKYKKLFCALICLLLAVMVILLPTDSWAKAKESKSDTKDKSIATNKATIQYTVNGLEDPALKNVLNRLEDEQSYIAKLSPEESVRYLDKKAPQAVKSALEPYGYFNPKITTRLEKQSQKKWHMTINVIPGAAVKVTSVNVSITGEGAKKPEFIKYKQTFPIKVGDQLNTATYDDSKKELSNIANELGFIRPYYKQSQIIIDRKQHSAVINLAFDTGPQYYFGPIHFQQSTYDEKFLQRFLKIKQGQPYSPSALLKLQQDLSGTSYFRRVTVEPQEHQTQGNDVPVNVTLIPSKSQVYHFGVGYGTDTDFRLTTTWDWNHITNTGQHMKTNLQLSQVQNSIDTRYIFTGKNPLTDQYYIGANYTEEQPGHSDGKTYKYSVGKQDLFYGWKRTLALSYQIDRYSLQDDPTRNSDLLIPSIALYRNNYDDLIFPRHGYSTTISLQGASTSVLSSTNFAQLQVTPKYIFSPTENSRVLLRGDFGYTATSDIEDIPTSLQFFAGGTDSIRGYDYDQLGPGKYLVVGSVEYQHRIKGNLFGTTFVDAGNAINSFSDPAGTAIGRQSNIHLTDILKTSAGFGIMYASPVGPLELTIAQPITDMHRTPTLQFRMGTNI